VKNKNFMTMALLGMAAGVCFFANDLTAWQRSAMSECKQDANDCKEDAGDSKQAQDKCMRKSKRCEGNASGSDESSFANELSAYSKSTFMKFTTDQKKQAMDAADNNKMTPDEAVAKVGGGCGC
jgi:hypothetical protein